MSADEILQNIQRELTQVRDMSYHDHFKKVGKKTVYEVWQDADKSVTLLRTALDPKCRVVTNVLSNII